MPCFHHLGCLGLTDELGQLSGIFSCILHVVPLTWLKVDDVELVETGAGAESLQELLMVASKLSLIEFVVLGKVK